MPIPLSHPLATSLTTLPSGDKSCPVCLESNVSFLKLTCNHHICVPCGSKADQLGMSACPLCRTPVVLDFEKLLKSFETHRAGYAAWRAGHCQGAHGELSDIRVPAQVFKGVIHHPCSGILFRADKEQKSVGSCKLQALTPASITPIHSVLLGPAAEDPSSAIVFLWLPKATMWTAYRVEYHAQRAIAAVRPGIDIVCLPQLPSSRELFAVWCRFYGLSSWQAIFFDPLLSTEEGDTLTVSETCAGRPMVTLDSVLKTLQACYVDEISRSRFHLYHSGLNVQLRDRIVQAGFGCLGDADEHPLIGSLAEAKGWIHSNFDPASERPSLSGSLRSGEIRCKSLHTPRGYVCHSAAEQRAAFHELKNVNPSTRVVLKPADGLGCAGLVLDATEADLNPSCVADFLSGERWTVEEMVGVKGGISPTVYMIGSSPIAVAEQLMEGPKNKGAITPCDANTVLQHAMTEAGKAIGAHLGLKGQWGLDFVIDEATQAPVVVDLNMGRPNGNLAYFMWRSLQSCESFRVPNKMCGAEAPPSQLHQISIWRSGPPGETIHSLIALLQKHNLLWKVGCAEGIVPVQHTNEGSRWSILLFASWLGRDAVLALEQTLKEVDKDGVYY